MLCCGYTLTDFPISVRLTSLALWQSNDCPSASKATLMNMDKYFMWIHYERLHNHNKAKHDKTVCIFLGIYCRCSCGKYLEVLFDNTPVWITLSPVWISIYVHHEGWDDITCPFEKRQRWSFSFFNFFVHESVLSVQAFQMLTSIRRNHCPACIAYWAVTYYFRSENRNLVMGIIYQQLWLSNITKIQIA